MYGNAKFLSKYYKALSINLEYYNLNFSQFMQTSFNLIFYSRYKAPLGALSNTKDFI